ncbi:MAG: alpha-glucosidase [Piscinibacter sp.]|uniref:alpha-glucosidase family protein n=1 Tax=Piscinibacter sp. TaxID=1903157 RepID=UPI00258F4598|nr:alpha-glucosidase family protein [Piscinibacter sp.]MCW5664725.1 alpha-glucosidase [Piscinibacter sp.]
MPTSSSTRDWWRGSVIYQVYPRSFADSNGDGIGDLPGITERLPYIAALGVDALWLSPFFRSPMKDFGYDVADHDDVDPMFGRLDDFVALTARAHSLGLKVIIDQVLSHTSDEHPWFVESRASRDNPKADWYVWADALPDGTPPNNWLSVFGGSAWQWDTRRRQYYLHNFLAAQPDLNFHCPAVQEALLEMLGRWLDRGVDGFRLDAINFCFHDRQLRDNPGRGMPAGDDPTAPAANPYSWQLHLHDKSQPEALQFLARVRALVEARGDAALLGEIGDELGMAMVAEYTAGTDRLHMGYCFDLLSAEHSAAYVRGVIERFEGMPGGGWPCWALSNHDCMRWATRWGGAAPPAALLRLGAALQLSLRGSVCLYQGEELGLPEAELEREQLRDPYGIAMWPEFKGRDGCRTPMPWASGAPDLGFGSGAAPSWLPVVEAHRPLAVDRQEADAGSQLQHVRRLLHWRRTQPALVRGAIELLPAHPRVLAFVRAWEGERVLCAFNLSDQAATLPLPGHDCTVDVLAASGADGARLAGAQGGEPSIEFDPYGVLFARLG